MKTCIRLAAGLLVLGSGAALAQDQGAAAYADIEKTFGSVPTMFTVFPDAGIGGAWEEFKSVQLSSGTALDNKTKELIGLAVSAQIPCSYCIYFHTAAARANGASDEEIKEAVAMAAISRHWSTVLNGMQVDPVTFKAEVDALMPPPAAAQASQ